jgi:hypothetical protein
VFSSYKSDYDGSVVCRAVISVQVHVSTRETDPGVLESTREEGIYVSVYGLKVGLPQVALGPKEILIPRP